MGPGSLQVAAEESTPWRAIFQRLSLAYHWTPEEILALTPPQLALYLTDEIEPAGAVAMSVADGMEYVARRREVRESWVDEVLHGREILRQEEPAQVVPAPELRNSWDRVHTPATSDAQYVLPPVVVSRVRALVETGSLVTKARRVVVEQAMADRSASRVATYSVEHARGVSTTARQVAGRAITRAGDASSYKLDELAQRIEMLAQSTNETQGAIERLERRRHDAAEFS